MKKIIIICGILISVIVGFWIYSEIIYHMVGKRCQSHLNDYKLGIKSNHVSPIMKGSDVVGYFSFHSTEVFMHPGFDASVIELSSRRLYSRYHFCAGPDMDEVDRDASGVGVVIKINDENEFIDKMIKKYGFKE